MSILLLMDDEGPPFPCSLFSAGEQGIWLDPSDFSTLFQDAAGTTPVTAVGQPVGLALDKSGRGNHAYQTTAASRPTLQQDSNGLYYLSFDGTDDGMATPSIDFTGTDKMTVWAGVRKLSDALSIICESSVDFGSNNGSFGLYYTSNFRFGSKGSTAASAAISASALAPVTKTLVGASSIADDRSTIYINGTQAGQSVSDQGTGNFGTYPLYIGRRGGTTLPFNGRIYQRIISGAASSDGQIAPGEAWCDSKARAY